MESETRYTFSFCIRRDGEVLIGADVGAGDSVEEITRAKKTIQRLLNEYNPAAKVPAVCSKKPKQQTEDPDEPPPVQNVTPPMTEKPSGVRGLIQVRCPECDNVFGTFLREYQTDVSCKCGRHIDLTLPLARFAYTCPYCEQTRWGRTNLEDPEITIRCKCGGEINLRWNPNAREYQN